MSEPLLVDSHCHLNFPDFKGEIDEVIARAHAAGVGVMQTICTKMSEAEEVRAIAEKYDNIYSSVGIHPHDAAKERTTIEELVEFAAHPKVIAIGETGLDYFYEHSPREQQQESFRTHIAAARELDIPVIIHTRDADEDTIDILKDEMEKGSFRGLIHCFSTSKWLAEEAIKMGLCISISGIVTFKKSTDLQDSVRDLPLDRLLVETDAPFLAPMPNRGKRNEPAYTRHTAEFLAELKGVSYAEVANVTTDNFFSLFSKAIRP